MANLTQSEKELLAVVKYYNDNQNKIDRLVYKLVEGLSIGQASTLTGYDQETVEAIHHEVVLRKGKRNVAKAIDGAKKAPAKLNKAAKEIAAAESLPAEVDAEFVKQGHTRLAIHLNSESDLVTRIASDITRAIESELKPGDKLWASRVIIDRFGARSNIVPTINKILMDHNWIEQVQSGNPRKGYVVK